MADPETISPSIGIRPLGDFPDSIPTLGEWHHREWSWLNPGKTLEDRIRKLEDSAVPGKIPCTFVAVSRGTLLGSASLIEEDMDTHRHLTPWLASVYIVSGQRGKGIGSLLVRGMMEEAKKLGIRRLYLFTPDRKHFYERLGWKVRETAPYRGQTVTIMETVP